MAERESSAVSSPRAVTSRMTGRGRPALGRVLPSQAGATEKFLVDGPDVPYQHRATLTLWDLLRPAQHASVLSYKPRKI
jgi:hypothetical protein